MSQRRKVYDFAFAQMTPAQKDEFIARACRALGIAFSRNNPNYVFSRIQNQTHPLKLKTCKAD
jgi:hypothetical protein